MGDLDKLPRNTAPPFIYLCLLLVCLCDKVTSTPQQLEDMNNSSDCFVKWMDGYKLGFWNWKAQKIVHSISLETCKQECGTVGCVAFAYGTFRLTTCELGIKLRSSPTDQNATPAYSTRTISIKDIDKSPMYSVYIPNPNSNKLCFKHNLVYPQGHQNGVWSPTQCFYRLLSGKRLVKTHILHVKYVNSLEECQEACNHERSFNCKSFSYRYMPFSGYSNQVGNCEMSSNYIQSGMLSSYSKLDYVEDYDYDYFQRDNLHCQTNSSIRLGVCSVVVRQGAKLSASLIKSYHMLTSTECEQLCVASLFGCRAFAYRTHGPYGYPSSSPTSPTVTRDYPLPSEHLCQLYDMNPMLLPSYNIEPDQDFDLFEMGRWMGTECVLYKQYSNRHMSNYNNPRTVTSTPIGYPPVENTGYFGGGSGDSNLNGGGDITVNGERCARGCRLNGDGTFYYCETAANTQGAVQYCCRPDNLCGYSRGLSVPWCYVGEGALINLWRECKAGGSRNSPFFITHDRVPSIGDFLGSNGEVTKTWNEGQWHPVIYNH